jgi:CDP-6-deoxy-D-xylo-4-hexulose-3-dehydrase
MNNNELRSEILNAVNVFGEERAFQADSNVANFVPGESFISTGGKVLDASDYVSMVDAVLDGWLTSGRFHDEFESGLANTLGVKSAAFVNSGSSANLLALAALTSKKLGERALKPGDEVVTPAAGFPTTITPILQLGLVPVFVDVEVPTYDAVTSQIVQVVEESVANNGKVKAIMMAHTLGNPFDVQTIVELCKKHNLWLIEDSCDALGGTYDFTDESGAKSTRMLGSFGDTATASFYPAHHITTGEGGAVFSSNPVISKEVRSFRDWGRSCWCETGHDNACGRRFDWQLGTLPKGYDHKYTYDNLGYNLKSTDIQAALGVSQLNKLPQFADDRRKNFKLIFERLSDLEASGKLILPKAADNSNPSWFGFPITLANDINREEIIRQLNDSKIGTRLVFASNVLRQPVFNNLVKDGKARVIGGGTGIDGDLPGADLVTNQSFWIGTHSNLTVDMIDYVSDKIHEFLK